MALLHLDTDIGGDIDDLCALAMVLKWPGAEISGITTSAEAHGRRAGYVKYILELAGRDDIPVAAGANASLDLGYRFLPRFPPEERFWPKEVTPQTGPLEGAFDLLRQSIERGAVIVALGPYTNLRLFDQASPGLLAEARIMLMGGSLRPPRAGLPPWSHEADYNVQLDVPSSALILERYRPGIVPLEVTIETALRGIHLDRLRAGDAVSQLIARQAEAFLEVWPENASYGQQYPRLPVDFINFLHDPLTCASALGWDGVRIEELPIVTSMQSGWLRMEVSHAGNTMPVVTEVDAARFDTLWCDLVCGNPPALL
jgi:inosine-uridine nucleoside N-ribohydrolase